MTRPYSCILTDSANQVWLDVFELLPEEIGLTGSWSVRKTTCRGGLSEGVDVIEIDNSALKLQILPTRGMGIWRGEYQGMQLGWASPVHGPVNPLHVNEQERGGLGWLRGFDEAIVRCGLESNGAPCRDTVTNNMGQPAEVELTLHGRIANTPASFVEVQVVPGEPPELVVTGRVYESGLFLPHLCLTTRISTVVGSGSFTITDEITNMRAVDSEMELLYHCNFGPPLLEEGAVLEVPACLVAPRDSRAAEGVDQYDSYLPPTVGYTEQCYWYETIGNAEGSTLALLRSADNHRGLALRYNRNELPCFTQWKNTAAHADGYVTGLEPGTNFPNPKPFERSHGRVPVLKPGESRSATVSFEVLDSAESVAAARSEIEVLQKGTEKVVHREPQPGYSDV